MKKNLFLQLCFMIICSWGELAVAQELININSNENETTLRAGKPLVKPEKALQSRVFDYNPRLKQLTAGNKGDILLLDFFDKEKYRAVIRDVSTDYDGVLGITAQIEELNFAACFIAISEAGITISANLPERNEHYLAVVQGGQTVLSQYKLSDMQKDELPSIAIPAPETPSLGANSQLRSSMTSNVDDDIEAPVTIDVMMVYTVAAKQWAASNATSIDNAIRIAFLYANYVLNNSQTNVTMNMVYKYETNYVEAFDDHTNLEALRNQEDSIMDEVHSLRKQYRADLVTMVSITYTGGGLAYFPNDEDYFYNYGYCDMGFSLSKVTGLLSGSAMIHELGHNMGCSHGNYDNDYGLFSYSSGYWGVDRNGNYFYTIMRYQPNISITNGNYSVRIPYFSNPDVSYNGVPTGDAETANNALTIKRTKHVISRYSDYINSEPVFVIDPNGALTKYNGAGGNVVIPADIGITAIGPHAFENCSDLWSVSIPSAVTSIGEYAFGDCSNLTQVTVEWTSPLSNVSATAFSGVNKSACMLIVPDGKKIAYGADRVWKDFRTITEITATFFTVENGVLLKYTGFSLNLVIPDNIGITAIGNSAFLERNLISVVIPKGVVSISESFIYCHNLQSIEVNSENPVYSSLDGVLYNKSQSTLITYPSGKEENLFVIPNSVTRIEYYAFYENNSLTSVMIPKGVADIGNSNFTYSYSFQSIEVDKDNPYYSSENGVLYNKVKTTLVRYPINKNITSFTPPNSVISIGNYAFWGCYNLTSITLPNSVVSIQTAAFSGCKNLTSITLPNSVISISGNAFLGCYNLTSITIPSSVTNISTNVFESALREVTVQWNTPLSISSSAFSSVNLSLAKLIVPTGKKTLYETAPVWKDFGTITEKALTSIPGVNPDKTTVSLENNKLKIDSPVSEEIYIYSVTGIRLYQKEKPAGEFNFSIGNIHDKVLVIKGGSGWVRKVLNNK
jgi:hypothetical protein